MTADRHAEVAYEQIAPVYDDFTAHHRYPEWIDSLLKLGATHGLQGNTVLDVGCGTGKGFMPLLDLGWDVTGLDISPSMVELARAKAGPGVRIEVADMREMGLYGELRPRPLPRRRDQLPAHGGGAGAGAARGWPRTSPPTGC